MSLFEAWAEEQGVTLSLDALRQMDSVARKQIAEMLGVYLSDPWRNGAAHALYNLGVEADDQELPFDLYPWGADTQAEACLIIGANEYGIQARPHGTPRTLNPLADNHTWGEVLVSVIMDLKIPCQVDEKSEEEFESVIFEYVVEQEWKSKDERERRKIQKLINQQLELISGLKIAGLNANKRRWVSIWCFGWQNEASLMAIYKR